MALRQLRECFRELSITPLTNHISEDDFVRICESREVHLRHCQAGDKILTPESNMEKVVLVVVSGRVHAIHESMRGDRFIIKSVEEKEALSYTVSEVENDNLSYSAEAEVDGTTVLLFDMKKFTRPWPEQAPESILLRNIVLYMLSAHHTTYQHLITLSKRTTRKKLVSFLLNNALNKQSNIFEITMTRQELADYLCVDRSAMSTELTRLKDTGLIDFKGNHFSIDGDLTQYL